MDSCKIALFKKDHLWQATSKALSLWKDEKISPFYIISLIDQPHPEIVFFKILLIYLRERERENKQGEGQYRRTNRLPTEQGA